MRLYHKDTQTIRSTTNEINAVSVKHFDPNTRVCGDVINDNCLTIMQHQLQNWWNFAHFSKTKDYLERPSLREHRYNQERTPNSRDASLY